MDNPFVVPKSLIVRSDGEVPYTVVHLHRGDYATEEGRRIPYDFYYLRTGDSIDRVVEAARAEFFNRGFGNISSDYSRGIILFQDGKAVVKPDKIVGMNFWVVEGLIYVYFEDGGVEPPTIVTERQPTKKLYDMIDTPHELRDTDASLIDILTAEERPSLIRIYDGSDAGLGDAARGHPPIETAVINYGHIWERHTTYFYDSSNDIWYALLNRDTITPTVKKWAKEENRRLPQLGKVVRIDSATFRESDKVMDRYFFDGTLDDIFEILKNNGIEVDKS